MRFAQDTFGEAKERNNCPTQLAIQNQPLLHENNRRCGKVMVACNAGHKHVGGVDFPNTPRTWQGRWLPLALLALLQRAVRHRKVGGLNWHALLVHRRWAH